MQVEASTSGFDPNTMVRATRTHRAIDTHGKEIKIKADTVGIPDSAKVENGYQFVHFEHGPHTPCVSFPVEALAPL